MSGTSAKREIVAGAVLGVATFAVYMVGSNRSFGYDAAATFANFIATPSIWDAFAVRSVIPTIPVTQVATNDHVLVSLLSHLIYSATGSRSEVLYRFLPALAAGGTVGLSTTALSRRFGLLAGICAGLYIATDPLFVDNSRDLRGYSLAALGSVAGTLILTGTWSRWRLMAYAAVMGLAMAAQLFVGVVLLCHLAWLVSERSWPRLRQLAPAWIAAALIGLGANAHIQVMEYTQHGLPPPVFYPTYPRDLILFIIGAPVLLPVGLWLAAAGLGLWTQRRAAWLWASLAVIAAAVLVLWLGLKPAFLYPRFFIFLVPASAFLMAAAMKRWGVVAPVVLLGAVVAAVSQAPGYTQDPLALRQAAAAVERIHASGQRACVIHSDEQVLSAYTSDFTVVTRPEQLADCDAVVVVSWGVDLALRDEAAREFPRLTTLPAYYPTVVLER
ncbi:MAG: hypothetical protein E6I71_12475 [Chloroflexi bacterium]|nr:MAG: hypothetical protein E6I71_12475 [Chloroflexota bacterium]